MADAPKHKRTPKDVAKLANAYLARSRGDAVVTLQEAITGASKEQEDAETRAIAEEQCISRAYVRAGSLKQQ